MLETWLVVFSVIVLYRLWVIQLELAQIRKKMGVRDDDI